METTQANTFPVTSEMVLNLLRQLPPREQLQIVVQVLPDPERNLSTALSPATGFWQSVDVRALAERQGVRPIDDFDALLGGWPEDEAIDDFIAALREWRRSNLAMVEAE